MAQTAQRAGGDADEKEKTRKIGKEKKEKKNTNEAGKDAEPQESLSMRELAAGGRGVQATAYECSGEAGTRGATDGEIIASGTWKEGR